MSAALISATRQSRNHILRTNRSGMAIVLVLGILAVAMALSYSLMRSQATAVQIQTNGRHVGSARLAAMTGMSAGLRKMHEASWTGVATGFSGAINTTDRYTVSYVTGDSSLLPTDPNYAEYPYRVTVTSTGYSQDTASSVTASHTIRAIARFNPVRAADPPSGWTTAQTYRVFQTGNDDFELNVPMRIEGLVRVQGTLRMGEDYGWSNSQRTEYFHDLNAKRTSQGVDYRPFNNRIDIPSSRLTSDASGLLTQLAITTQNLAESLLPNWAFTSDSYRYRLYPGGKEYTAQTLASSLTSVTLGPDPLTNPAGVFQIAGGVTLNNNVSIQGTLLTTGSGTIDFRGQNISLTPYNFPALVSSTLPTRLPTVVASDDFRVCAGTNASVTGLVYVGDRFEVEQDTQTAPFNLRGRLIARGVRVLGRTEYDNVNWGGLLSQVLRALLGLLFPDWLNQEYGLDPQPRVQITPEGSAPVASYHWSPTAPTIFVQDPADLGLRWDLINWSDGGQ